MDSEQFSASPEPIRQPEQLGAPLEVGLSPEVGVFGAGPERFEQRSETPSAGAPAVLPTVVVNPTTAQDTTQDDVKSTTSNNPTAAKDADSIEKEWINRVKQVLKETKEDPYKKEEEVKAIKIDYLDKRYNRKLGNGD